MLDAGINGTTPEATTGWHESVPLWWMWTDPCPHCGLARCDNPAHFVAEKLPRAPERQAPARPTPSTTVEAIMYTVRERGPQALREPNNIERLRRCDKAALAVIDRCLKRGGLQ